MSRPEYSQWSQALSRVSNAWDTPLNLAATAGNYAALAVHAPISLNRISFLVTTATTSGSVAGAVSFVRFPTYGATTNSVAIGTLTIPTAAAVGAVYYKDLQTKGSFALNAGEELMVRIAVQQVDSGTAAGAGWVGFTYDPAPDAVGNQSNMTASA